MTQQLCKSCFYTENFIRVWKYPNFGI